MRIVRRMLGSALLVVGLASVLVVQTVAPAPATNAAAGIGALAGSLKDTGGGFELAIRLGVVPQVGVGTTPVGLTLCPTTLAFNNLFFQYTLESPAVAGVPAGALFSAGNIAPGATFSGSFAGICTVTGTLSPGAVGFVSTGAATVVDVHASYTVCMLSTCQNYNEEWVFVLVGPRGSDDSAVTGDGLGCAPGNLSCAEVAGAAALA